MGVLKGKQLTGLQVARLAYKAGVRGWTNLVNAVGVCWGESHYFAEALNNNPKSGDLSYGLWQINMKGAMGPARRAEFGLASNEDLYKPEVNARAMFAISKGGTDWTPWGAFTNGGFEDDLKLGKAAAAVNALTKEMAAEASVATYTVKKGDTLTKIAKAKGTTVPVLVKLNKLADPDDIAVGKVLKLPAVKKPAAPAEPAHDYRRISRSGVTINRRTSTMLNRAQELAPGVPIPFDLTQGSYNRGGVTASAGTHDGGGAVDISVLNHKLTASQRNTVVKALRMAGFAAWLRSPAEGNWPWHIHAIAIGDKEMSSGAKKQVAAYFAGRNGLANGRADSVSRPYPAWAKKYA